MVPQVAPAARSALMRVGIFSRIPFGALSPQLVLALTEFEGSTLAIALDVSMAGTGNAAVGGAAVPC
jgi:hypothetical protein